MNSPFLRTLRLLTHLSGYFDLQGIQLLMQSHYTNCKRYVDEPQKRVWTNLAMPNELFHAMDLPTVFTENISAILAGGRQSMPPLKAAYSNLLSMGGCTYISCAIGVLEKEYLPPPRIFVCPSLICEDAPKTFQYLSKKYRCEYFYLDVPYVNDDDAEIYVENQLRELAMFLEDHTHVKFEMEKLQEAVALSNVARSYALKAAALRSRCAPLMYGASGLRLLGLLSKFGSRDGAEIAKNIYKELNQRCINGTSPIGNKKYRILWLHLYPYYQNKLLRYLEDELDAAIVFEENNEVYWEPLDEKTPFRCLAKRLLNIPVTGMRRVEKIVQMAQKYRVDGAIHFSHLGCKIGCGGVQFIRERLSEMGIGFLELTGDNIDYTNYSQSQIETRLEAFVEILEQRKAS